MVATLTVSHRAVGAEVRRGPYEIELDGRPAGTVELNQTFETNLDPGRHTLQVRNGRNSSATKTFEIGNDEVAAFRCTGKRFLPLFLASFVIPGLALVLVRD
ncbi:hypothetical protein OEB99_10465 [Actinotalea sp. M2MS4P-6]|uniref:hypothetical protein n=1 Tax=Actinotalea sp. M2MS4P-6 TaxID=2983762 RepID=UPI0021E3C1DA|nr:hypothetical protein [Actinotalea sp. M2MS4P-6]MCV2394730.1 hypothetical protein [Actinotalea sp. M2MS4P-6]